MAVRLFRRGISEVGIDYATFLSYCARIGLYPRVPSDAASGFLLAHIFLAAQAGNTAPTLRHGYLIDQSTRNCVLCPWLEPYADNRFHKRLVDCFRKHMPVMTAALEVRSRRTARGDVGFARGAREDTVGASLLLFAFSSQ